MLHYSKTMIGSKDKVTIIGVGRLGSALIKALHKTHYTIVGLIDHNLTRAEQIAAYVNAEMFSDTIFNLLDAGIIFISVPDDEIASVVSDLKIHFERKRFSKFVFHTSGVLTSDVFDPLRKYGVAGASFHPIQTFAGEVDDWKKFRNIYFGVEGDPTAIEKASQMIRDLKSHKIIIPKKFRSLYHLDCTIASNYMVSLMVPVVDLFEEMNFSEQETLKILFPLLSTTLSNLRSNGIEGALTGPISRGDIGTIKKHLEILSDKFPAYKSMYQLHGKILLELKSVSGKIYGEKHNDMRKLLMAKD